MQLFSFGMAWLLYSSFITHLEFYLCTARPFGGKFILQYLSRCIKNQQSAYAKPTAQISCTVTAQLISAFVFATWILQSLFFLNLKFQVRGLCRTWSERKLLVFSCEGSQKSSYKIVPCTSEGTETPPHNEKADQTLNIIQSQIANIIGPTLHIDWVIGIWLRSHVHDWANVGVVVHSHAIFADVGPTLAKDLLLQRIMNDFLTPLS